MASSSTHRIDRALLNEPAELPGLEQPCLAVPFLHLPPQFHRKSKDIYIYKMGTEDEVQIRMAKPPRDGKDFYDLAMALTNHTTFHRKYVFVEHVLPKDALRLNKDEKNFLDRIYEQLNEIQKRFYLMLTLAKEQYMNELRHLKNEYLRTSDKNAGLLLVEKGNKRASEEEQAAIKNAIEIRNQGIFNVYPALEYIVENLEAITQQDLKNRLRLVSSQQKFNEKFANIGGGRDEDQDEVQKKSTAFIKALDEKSKRVIKNLLIDAAIAGYKKAYTHLELESLNCSNGIKLKTIAEEDDQVEEELANISSSSSQITRSVTVDGLTRTSTSPNGQEQPNRPSSTF